MRFGITVIALAAALCAGALSAGPPAIGEIAPNFKFDKVWNGDPDKNELAAYRGSLVVIDVWATW